MPYTLYVIELDPEVLTRKRFVAVNPDHRPEKPCVYVGMTGRIEKSVLPNTSAAISPIAMPSDSVSD